MPAREFESVTEGQILHEVDPVCAAASNLTGFMNWLRETALLDFDSYESLWGFSISQVERFWALWWSYYDSKFSETDLGKRTIANNNFDPTEVLSDRDVFGPNWFVGKKLNYARYALSADSSKIAVIAINELGRQTMTYGELSARVAALAYKLSESGVSKGDGVVGYVSNGVAAVVGFLATVSLGAIWSSCSLEFGVSAVVDRFSQLKPKTLICDSTYSYNGKIISRIDEIEDIVKSIPSLMTLVLSDVGRKPIQLGSVDCVSFADWSEPISGLEKPSYVDVDFMDPLWVLYSSGTTGLPKAIIHSHGGIVLEHTKVLSLHCDIKQDDVFAWYTTTGWMMWNFLVSGLLLGATVVLVDGSPSYPGLLRLFQIVEAESVAYFGASAPFIEAAMKADVVPNKIGTFPKLRTIGSTGAPLSPRAFSWLFDNVSSNLNVESVSGGTDLCTAFLLSTPMHPTRAGELNVAALGADVCAYDDDGKVILDEVGELVIRSPMPSMPVAFLNDPGRERLFEAYFGTFLGVWRHGDWIKKKTGSGFVIYGRSDSTLNRGGIRMGTAEFYRVVEQIPGIVDSMIIDTSRLGSSGELVLFVVLDNPSKFSEKLMLEINATIKSGLSPRHVPNHIFAVSGIPRTLNGKKMEVPIRRIFLGENRDDILSAGSMQNPSLVDEFYLLYDCMLKS